MVADKKTCLKKEVQELQRIWPENQMFHIVCHGHSIPCGYMAENVTRPFDAYPHLLHEKLSERFPHSVINVTVTAIGGENAVSGAKRFQKDVLRLEPDLITIDYGRNDMFLTEEEMRMAWESMIREAHQKNIKVLLITPAADSGAIYYEPEKRKLTDQQMAEIIRELAEEYGTGLADAEAVFEDLFAHGHRRSEYAASVNHPNRRGHEIVADCLAEWFPYC